MGGRFPTYLFMTRNRRMIASWLVVIEYKLHTARTCRVGIPFDASNPSGIAQPRQPRPL